MITALSLMLFEDSDREEGNLTNQIRSYLYCIPHNPPLPPLLEFYEVFLSRKFLRTCVSIQSLVVLDFFILKFVLNLQEFGVTYLLWPSFHSPKHGGCMSKCQMYFCSIWVVPDTFPLHIKCDDLCRGKLFNSLSLKAQAPESSSNPFRESWSFHNGHKSRQLHSGGK